jgi:catecholate siderophore receptor
VRTGTFDRSQWGTTASFGTTNGQTTTLGNLGGNTILTRSGLSPRKDSYDATYLQSDYSTKADWFGMKHELLAGVDAAFEKANRYSGYGAVGTNYNKGNTTVGTLNDGRVTDNVPTYRNTSNYDGQGFGVYAQDLVQVASHWKLPGGCAGIASALTWTRSTTPQMALSPAIPVAGCGIRRCGATAPAHSTSPRNTPRTTFRTARRSTHLPTPTSTPTRLMPNLLYFGGMCHAIHTADTLVACVRNVEISTTDRQIKSGAQLSTGSQPSIATETGRPIASHSRHNTTGVSLAKAAIAPSKM